MAKSPAVVAVQATSAHWVPVAASILKGIFWPIVFLSWLPFISSNMILLESLRSGFTHEAVINLMQVFPNFDPRVAAGLFFVGLVSAVVGQRPAHLLALLPYGALLYAAIFVDTSVGIGP